MIQDAAVVASLVRLVECDNDRQLLELWLQGKSPQTRRSYERDVMSFLTFIEGKPLAQVSAGDVENFILALSVAGYAAETVRRRVSGIRSLLSYGQKIGYLALNVGRAVKLPPGKETLAERLLTESNVALLIHAAEPGRDRLMLKFLYKIGCRVSELCAMKWKDLQLRSGGGQVTVRGKGNRVRAVLVPPSLWSELLEFQGQAGPEEPIFATKSGRHFNPRNVREIVYRARDKAGIMEPVSPHWLRHAHASHALERGAKIHLVAQTLGHSSVAVTGRYLHARPTDSSSLYLPD